MPKELDALTAAWAEFLSPIKDPLFCTLTFRREVHPEAADKRFRVWISKINRILYGVRWSKHGRGVDWARAIEMQRREVIHYHALVGGPDVSRLHRLTLMDEWEELAGYARIEPARSDDAVRRYVTKYVIKDGEIDIGGPSYDARPPPAIMPAGRDWRPSAPLWRESTLRSERELTGLEDWQRERWFREMARGE